MKVKLVNFNRTFLELSWIWLNDDELKYLTQTPVFTRDDQLLWFKKLPANQNYKIWGIKAENIPIGACGIKNIKGPAGEYWGYIGLKNFRGKGIGKQVMILIENKAVKLNLESLWLKVIQDNKNAIRLYEKSGYITERKNDDLIIMRKTLIRYN